MSIRTYKVDCGWVVSDDSVWLPGVYADEETAKHACNYKTAFLQSLADVSDNESPITMCDLENFHDY